MMLARICGVLAIAGVGVLVVAPNAALAYLGFGIIGLGVSVGFPLGVSAAAALPGSASQNVAVLSFVALTGFLVGPPVIGFIAEHVAMRVGLAVLIPALIVSLAFTSRLRKAAGQPHEPAPELQSAK
jgi:MFS family permease